nr:CbbQ/NirQ/NorQ C-terminal domain-containing protein [Gammaproteobacteria bacterium]
DYPAATIEAEIVAHEGNVDQALAEKLVRVAQRSRNLNPCSHLPPHFCPVFPTTEA